MRIAGKKKIEDYSRRYPDAKSALLLWVARVEEAKWTSFVDVKALYPAASFLGDGVTIFNIKGNTYRLEAKINYQVQQVLIGRFGTHSDYDKWKW